MDSAFDLILASDLAVPHPLPVRSLAELLFAARTGEDDGQVLLAGSLGAEPLDVSLRTLRHAVLALADRLAAEKLAPGSTVALIRLPRTSETLVAVAYLALTAAGYRVLLPMYLERPHLADWLRRSGASLVIWSEEEGLHRSTRDPDRELFRALAEEVSGLGIPARCLIRDLAVPGLLGATAPASPPLDDPRVARMLEATGEATECLLLTTSGTSGRAKLVRYAQGAFLRSAAAWEAAGLFAAGRLAGRGLCLLLAHSMGLRTLWNALWTRQALCLIPPEWFVEQPERARAFLIHQAPAQVSGGPAVYRTLLELGRVFPQLKDACFRNLRGAVSIGAGFDADLAARLRTALGLELHNGFGMTETMLAASTLVRPGGGPAAEELGDPLPGVRLGLEAVEEGGSVPTYRLYVSSPFGALGYLPDDETPLERSGWGEWLRTGDLVTWDGRALRHAGRERDDFVKDGFGVKVPRARFAELYAGLEAPVLHVEGYPVQEEPGLAGLVFVDLPGGDGGAVVDEAVEHRVRSLLEARHEALRPTLEEFEFRHFTLLRFACVAGPPPRTAKGSVARPLIAERHGELLRRLTGPWLRAPGIRALEREPLGISDAIRFAYPRRAALLRVARLDKTFRAGRGDRVTYTEQGHDVEVVDLVGGFGGNLLGHRHPGVIAAARAFLEGDGIPIGDQGSARPEEGGLARRLAQVVSGHTGRSYVVRLASTGAEAVELALAHAFLEWRDRLLRQVAAQKRAFGASHPEAVARLASEVELLLATVRPRVLCLRGAFHGHSLGARSLLSQAKRRVPFAPLLRLEPVFLPPEGDGDLAPVLEASRVTLPALAEIEGEIVPAPLEVSRIIASIAEPILGEGGVTVVSLDLLRRLAALEAPLILDEIQCGLGRSGTFLASEGVVGAYYLFAKALGGGVVKVAATVIERGRFFAELDDYYASTFAGDAFSSTVASAVLEIIDREDVPARARDRGAAVAEALEALAREYPDVIHHVAGRGLIHGLALAPRATEHSLVLRGAEERELLGILAASYLLNVHRVRVLPTLSAPSMLRIEPSAFVDDATLARLSEGLHGLCAALRACDLAGLLAPLMAEDRPAPDAVPWERPRDIIDGRVEPPAPGAVRIGFLHHFVHPERELAALDPTLARCSPTERRALFHRMAVLLDGKPITAYGRNLLGGRIYFHGILVPYDTVWFETQLRAGDVRVAIDRVQEAVDYAAARGCTVAALGAHTSIVTDDGRALLAPAGCRITSGNTFTAAVGAHRIRAACVAAGISPACHEVRLAVVGASGNIGQALCRLLLTGEHRFHGALLVGRRRATLERAREALAADLVAAGVPAPDLAIATDVAAVRDCRVVAVATGTNERLIYPEHLRAGAPVVVGDLSVPGAVSEAARKLPNVHFVALAGAVPVPGAPDFVMSTHSPRGTAFCCAAEGMLLGLEPGETAGLPLVGDLDAHAVRVLHGLGVRHGFLAGGGT
jgi:acetylornithine/succinyldiaminopimelate/putrescine aminotransferase/predicted amino acid dehydrogenase/acyl-coenzyme A synthetase/AMP-(fatty) acid ligase